MELRLSGISHGAILVVVVVIVVVVGVVGPVFTLELQLDPIGVSKRVVHHRWGLIASVEI